MARQHDQRGVVTAETATVLPVLVLVAAALAWVVAYGVNQARVVDAARETARALARGDDEARSTSLGMQIAPAGSAISVREEGGDVIVTVRAAVRGPGGVLGLLPGHELHAEAVAAREPS